MKMVTLISFLCALVCVHVIAGAPVNFPYGGGQQDIIGDGFSNQESVQSISGSQIPGGGTSGLFDLGKQPNLGSGAIRIPYSGQPDSLYGGGQQSNTGGALSYLGSGQFDNIDNGGPWSNLDIRLLESLNGGQLGSSDGGQGNRNGGQLGYLGSSQSYSGSGQLNSIDNGGQLSTSGANQGFQGGRLSDYPQFSLALDNSQVMTPNGGQAMQYPSDQLPAGNPNLSSASQSLQQQAFDTTNTYFQQVPGITNTNLQQAFDTANKYIQNIPGIINTNIGQALDTTNANFQQVPGITNANLQPALDTTNANLQQVPGITKTNLQQAFDTTNINIQQVPGITNEQALDRTNTYFQQVPGIKNTNLQQALDTTNANLQQVPSITNTNLQQALDTTKTNIQQVPGIINTNLQQALNTTSKDLQQPLNIKNTNLQQVTTPQPPAVTEFPLLQDLSTQLPTGNLGLSDALTLIRKLLNIPLTNTNLQQVTPQQPPAITYLPLLQDLSTQLPTGGLGLPDVLTLIKNLLNIPLTNTNLQQVTTQQPPAVTYLPLLQDFSTQLSTGSLGLPDVLTLIRKFLNIPLTNTNLQQVTTQQPPAVTYLPLLQDLSTQLTTGSLGLPDALTLIRKLLNIPLTNTNLQQVTTQQPPAVTYLPLQQDLSTQLLTGSLGLPDMLTLIRKSLNQGFPTFFMMRPSYI